MTSDNYRGGPEVGHRALDVLIVQLSKAVRSIPMISSVRLVQLYNATSNFKDMASSDEDCFILSIGYPCQADLGSSVLPGASQRARVHQCKACNDW